MSDNAINVMNESINRCLHFLRGVAAAGLLELACEFRVPRLRHFRRAVEDLPAQVGARFRPARLRFPRGHGSIPEVLP